nr:hypothetical protein [uncultured Brevundimonas sp.]
MQEWIELLALPFAIFVAVCWASHKFGKTIRKGEIETMELEQGARLADQDRRIKSLRAELGENN